MLLFLFIILAGNAARCDDASNNYYVIEMPEEDTPLKEFKKPFNVYWNVPTMQCTSKKIPFSDLYQRFGIIQNGNDNFRGDEIAILYDPGLFPALLKNETSGKFKFRNGGVPQEGNIDSHLDAFRLTMEQSIPDVNFKGVGIIDFESWRPIFRQNFGVLIPYKDVSYEIEKKAHWWWPQSWVQDEATKRFEAAARVFMQNTVSIAKQMRPKAKWGYYGFPYCFNVAANNPGESCPANVVQENNQLQWLWSESTALYPSVYSSKNLTSKQLASLIRGRVAEASRIRKKGTPILPYFWFRYRDGGFMSELDLETALKTMYKSNASGFIIWGSSNDVNTIDKCNKLESYVNNILGPAIAKYTKQNRRVDDKITTDDPDYLGDIITTDSNTNMLNDTTTIQPLLENIEVNKKVETLKTQIDNTDIPLDPEFHWIPPENYNQDIIRYVEEELYKKSKQNSSSYTEKEHSYIFKENLVIDMLLNALSNSKSHFSTESNDSHISTEGTFSNNDYSVTQINKLTSTSNYPTVDVSTRSPIPDKYTENKERPSLSDIILNSPNIYVTTTEESKSTVNYDNFTNFNTLTFENVVNVNTFENNNEVIEQTHAPSSDEYLTVTNTEKGETIKITSSFTTTQTVDTFETVTETLNTSTDSIDLYRTEFDNYLDTNTSYITTETNLSPKLSSITVNSNSGAEETLGSDSIAEDLNLSTPSSTISEVNVPYSNLNSLKTTETTTLNDVNTEDFIYIYEEGNSGNDSSFLTDVSVYTNNTESSTDELYVNLVEIVTESSAWVTQTNNITNNAVKDETTEENFTSLSPSTSLPDKVVVYIL